MDANWLGFSFNSFLIVFIIINMLNVILSTTRSLVTLNCGKVAAAITNALSFGVYTIVIVFTAMEGLGIIWKAGIIAVVNFIGVYIVKLCEEKSRKDKLWKIEVTVLKTSVKEIDRRLSEKGIYHIFLDIGETKWALFNCYCHTKEESSMAKEILQEPQSTRRCPISLPTKDKLFEFFVSFSLKIISCKLISRL